MSLSSLTDQRAAALRVHIERLSPNLIRAYVLDMIEDAAPIEIDKMVVAFHAQNSVPAKK